MVNGRFNDNDIEQLFHRFMAELDERWNAMNMPNERRFFNFDEIYDAACIRHPPLSIFEPANIELRRAVENILVRRRRIEFVNEREIHRIE
jgi:hypothetical protein